MNELIERLEKATGPDRELDMAIGKATGLIPADAAWRPLDPENTIDVLIGSHRSWELPSFTLAQAEWTAKMNAYIGSPEYYAAKADDRWTSRNPAPGSLADWGHNPPAGPVPHVTASIDAALALVERVLPGTGVALATPAVMPDHKALATLISQRFERGQGSAATLPIAICLALLKVRALNSESSNGH